MVFNGEINTLLYEKFKHFISAFRAFWILCKFFASRTGDNKYLGNKVANIISYGNVIMYQILNQFPILKCSIWLFNFILLQLNDPDLTADLRNSFMEFRNTPLLPFVVTSTSACFNSISIFLNWTLFHWLM